MKMADRRMGWTPDFWWKPLPSLLPIPFREGLFRRQLSILFIVGLLFCLTGCKEERIEIVNGEVRANGPCYPDGSWQMKLKGFTHQAVPGEELNWSLGYSMEGTSIAQYFDSITSLKLAIAARRICDEKGRYKDQDGYLTSTFLTPGGLAVEGYQYLIANSTIGGPYRTPLDEVRDVPLSTVKHDRTRLSFEMPVKLRLAEDFPAGLYRIEAALFAQIKEQWIQLPVLGAVEQMVSGCDVDYEDVFYSKLLLPPMKIGNMEPPRMIWTLFTSLHNLGVSGAVAKEDEPHFAISNRIRPQTRYILPCTPDRGDCSFRIRPDFPTFNKGASFYQKEYNYNNLDLDGAPCEFSVTVERPDGQIDDLGNHKIRIKKLNGPELMPGGPKYRFDQFGKYLIRMEGQAIDRFKNRYDGGGTYEVWIAYPLTFATGIKPGNPMQTGHSYSAAAAINPPVPAEVTATVRFFPALNPKQAMEQTYTGKAQRFGYFFPGSDQPPLIFPGQGEYSFEIFATYTDRLGRTYMGNMKNGSVVLADQGSMTISGAPNDAAREITLSRPFDEFHFSTIPVCFPENSGEMFYFTGNAHDDEAIFPMVTVSEPTGFVHEMLKRHFPPTLVTLHQTPESYANNRSLLPGSMEQMIVYARHGKTGRSLPLMSTTSKGYSPFEYPELVNRRGYFYISASRPGFPAYFVVGDSTINENYWNTGTGDYGATAGAAKKGDQPGDIYWSLVTGLFTAEPEQKELVGQYGAGGVCLPRGVEYTAQGPAFARPVANINGIDLELYAGVGPAPGALYETGAIKGVGSIAVPMTPHDVEITIVKPDGQKYECKGRADEIGNFNCPNGPMTYDLPGVYRVLALHHEGRHRGWCPGSVSGWYNTYAVAKESPYRVLFENSPGQPVDYDENLVVRGRVTPNLKQGKAWYSVVAPGLLIDEGVVDVASGTFRLDFLPSQWGAQFSNLFDQPGVVPLKPLIGTNNDVKGFLLALVSGQRKKVLSDTIEITVFVQGDDSENQVTAGGKFILRGNRMFIPTEFRADSLGSDS